MDIFIATTEDGRYIGTFFNREDAFKAVQGKGGEGYGHGNIYLADKDGGRGTKVFYQFKQSHGGYGWAWTI